MTDTTLPSRAALRTFHIPTMDCPVEEGEIRRALEEVPGIQSLRFQLGARTLGIAAPDDTLAQALDVIRKAGFEPRPVQANPKAHTAPASQQAESCCSGHETCAPKPSPHSHDHDHDHGDSPAHGDSLHAHTPLQGWGLGRLVLALVLAFVAESIGYFAPDTTLFKGLGLGVAALAIALSGIETYTKGLQALRHGKLNINALMTVAVTGAFAIGHWPEAAMVMALYAIAELIEARSVDRARNAIQGLLALAPAQALVHQPDGAWSVQPASDVPLQAVVRVKPGERLPLDGIVTEGRSAVDQSPVTGESLPVDKQAGDTVFAGTVNQTGELTLRVTALAQDTTLARIIEAVEQAQASRAPTQRFVDQFASVYTPAVFFIALTVAVLGPWLGGWTALEAIYKALVLLVIACPCALVISTPVTVVSALANAARQGVLIKGGVHLENARRIRVVALDKTGTVTQGKPRLVDWSAWHGQQGALDHDGSVARRALALARRSDHPVSRAIAGALDSIAQDQATAPIVAELQALPGQGVMAHLDGTPHWLGNHRLAHGRGQCTPALEAELSRHEQAGRTVTLLMDAQGVCGLFAVADTIKDTSAQAVADLKALGVHTAMLSGDNQATAQAVAAQAGINEVQGSLMPEDKLKALDQLRARHGMVAMAGDGINDAPALAQSDLGIAMGVAGTDTAMEAADMVIMNDDLRRIPAAIRLSRKTYAVLWQNISLALGIKAVFLVMALVGSATMWMAVFADMGASLLVVANGLRLLRTRA